MLMIARFRSRFCFMDDQPAADDLLIMRSLAEDDSQPDGKWSLFNFIDSHLRELRWTAYGFALTSLLILLKKTKAVSKFKKIHDIPQDFIQKNYSLQGAVKQVTPEGDLMVDHVPVIEIRSFQSGNQWDQLLRLRLAGICMSDEGVSWLQSNIAGRAVWFELLQHQGTAVDCDIMMRKMAKIPLWNVSVNQELVRQGLCKVRPFESPPDGKLYGKLVNRLIALEHHASRRGKGMWKEEKKTRWWRSKGSESSLSRMWGGLKRLVKKKDV